MSKLDDLTAWRYFVAFARSGTLTAAATAMDVNTANISRAITGLEKALGVPLVRHNARPLELTKEGAQALKRMETILRAHDALISQISDDRRSLEGKIRLSSAPGFASRRLTGLLHRFKELHPEMTIEILGGLKEADVQKGFCEVATLTGEPTLSGLVYMSRGRNVYLPVASPEYVKRFGMPFSPENLRTHTGYVYNGPVREETKMLYRGDDAEPVVFDRSVRSTDILAIRQALLDGMGVAVDMPLVQIVEDLRRGALVPGMVSSARRVLQRDEPSRMAKPPRADFLRVVLEGHAGPLRLLRSAGVGLRGTAGRKAPLRSKPNLLYGCGDGRVVVTKDVKRTNAAMPRCFRQLWSWRLFFSLVFLLTAKLCKGQSVMGEVKRPLQLIGCPLSLRANPESDVVTPSYSTCVSSTTTARLLSSFL